MKSLNHLVRPVLRRVRPERTALEDMRLSIDRAWYAETYPDIAASGLEPDEHFIQRGAFEGRRPNRFFDPAWYVQRYGDAAGQLPILHYATKGRQKRYDPGPAFSSSAYLETHRDVAASGIDPLDHYVLHGQHEQRAIKPVEEGPATQPDTPSYRRLTLVARLDEDQLPGRERLARVQETFSMRDAGLGSLRVVDNQLAAPREPAPPTLEQVRGSPFWFYNCFLNAEGTILRYARQDLTPHPDYLTNFLGVKLAPRHFGGSIAGREGEIEAPPLPSNWHADLTEWAAVLRAVDLAGTCFTMAELGCTWACWLANAGAAARHTGRTIRLVGVESEDDMTIAEEVLETNGFSNRDYSLERRAKGTPTHSTTFLESDDRIDLLHVDVQGGEAEFVRDNLAALGANVAYLVISTHSREAEGSLFVNLGAAGWHLEVERPAYLHLTPDAAPAIKIDGAQGWRNMTLLPH